MADRILITKDADSANAFPASLTIEELLADLGPMGGGTGPEGPAGLTALGYRAI